MRREISGIAVTVCTKLLVGLSACSTSLIDKKVCNVPGGEHRKPLHQSARRIPSSVQAKKTGLMYECRNQETKEPKQ